MKDIFLILRRRLAILLIITISIVVITGIISCFVVEPQYKAFTTLLVGKSQNYDKKIEYDDILLSEKLVSTYEQIINSRLTIDTVISELDLDTTYEKFKKNIKVYQLKDAGILRIEIIDKDPQLAANIANKLSNIFISNIKDLLKTDNVKVIDEAKVPSNQFSPKPIIDIIIVGILGVFIVSFSIIFFENINNKIKTEKDIKKYLGLPVIGVIPKNLKQKNIKNNEAYIFNTNEQTRSNVFEAFRTLRTNIQFLNSDKKIKTIVITSPREKEGKSTIVSNLALMISKIEKRVLIIDGDLRKPSIHLMFELFNYKGITSILTKGIEYKEAVQSAGYNGIDILTSGPIPQNPSELLSSNKMKVLLKEIVDDYDMVLIDSPPICLVTDTSLLSKISDCTILVCASEQTKVEAATTAKDLLISLKTDILGVVLNKMSVKKIPYYMDQYFDYYNYNLKHKKIKWKNMK